MKRNVKVLGIGIGLAAAALALVLATSALAQTPTPGYGQGGWGPGGMMGGGGMMGRGFGQSGQPGPQGGWGMGPGMMGGSWGSTQPSGNPISMDQAQQAAEQAIASSGYQNLAIDEIMEFGQNFYVDVKEKDSGVHAFELLVDRYSGAIHPEPGPNMMWNTKYGMMGPGMMGGWWGGQSQQSTADMPVTADQAIRNANDYLSQAFPGAQAADDPATFYGYYTMDFAKDGKTLGMLSVNGYSGQVWLHTWHGDFVSEKQIGS